MREQRPHLLPAIAGGTAGMMIGSCVGGFAGELYFMSRSFQSSTPYQTAAKDLCRLATSQPEIPDDNCDCPPANDHPTTAEQSPNGLPTLRAEDRTHA